MPDMPHDGLLRVLTGHTMAVEVLVIAPDGTWLASAGNDGTVRIWDPDTGQTRHTLTGHTRPIRTMALRYDRTFMRPMLPTA